MTFNSKNYLVCLPSYLISDIQDNKYNTKARENKYNTKDNSTNK